MSAARARWDKLDPGEKQRVSAVGNVVPDVIEFYLSDPLPWP